MRSDVLSHLDEAVSEVAAESGLPTEPGAELLVVDRRGWISGNVRTLSRVFGDIPLPVEGTQARVVGWEGGAFLGLLARAVLAQYDPFRDQLIVVYPNLGDVAEGDGLRWLLFHEVTHLAQFRGAPWIRDYVLETGRSILGTQDRDWMKQVPRELAARLPELVKWVRDAMQGTLDEDASTPLLDLLPPGQKELVAKLNSLLTVLEGHATHVTDLISTRLIPDYEQMQRRIKEQRQRPPLLKLLEALAGLEMKRRQYTLGRSFCAEVWASGGAEALAPVWRSPEAVPTPEELREPARWLARVS